MATPKIPESLSKGSATQGPDYTDVSDAQPMKLYSANIVGVVTTVSNDMLTSSSPGKKRYYTGSISDGRSKRRLVGFTESKRKLLHQFLGQSVAISACKCTSGRTNELEITVGDKSEISSSQKQYVIPEEDLHSQEEPVPMEIILSSIESLPLLAKQSYILAATVVSICDVKTLEDGRRLQNVVIADQSGSATLTLWESWVGSVFAGNSYKFTNLRMKEYNNKKSLFTPKQTDVPIIPIAPLENVAIPPANSIVNAKVVAVSNLSSSTICIVCKGKVTPINSSDSTEIGHCSKCESTVLLGTCKQDIEATLTILGEEGTMHTLKASQEILKDITRKADISNISALQLLTSSPFTAWHNGISISKIAQAE